MGPKTSIAAITAFAMAAGLMVEKQRANLPNEPHTHCCDVPTPEEGWSVEAMITTVTPIGDFVAITGSGAKTNIIPGKR